MKRVLLVFLSILMFFTASCSKKVTNSENIYFTWMNTYYAMGVGSEAVIALTCFCVASTQPINSDDITGLEFDGIQNNVLISSYEVKYSQADSSQKYSHYNVIVNFSANNQGVYETNKLIFDMKDGRSLSYLIGMCVFDVGEKETETDDIDLWSSPVASSKGDEFPYTYDTNSPDDKIIEMQVGKNQIITSANGLAAEGKILLHSTAPVNYIKTKIIVEVDGKNQTFYGKGCYCGGVNLTDADIEKYIEFANSNS